MSSPAILDQYGKPLPSSRATRAAALISGGRTPYDAADQYSAEMAGWTPWLGSPDSETTPYRDQSVARIRDLVRNDGWASGAIMRITDATIGADFRLSANPDYRALARRFGTGFDATWAKEFRDAAEACWRAWASDPGRYCDVSRRLTFGQMARLAFRHYLIEGEALSVVAYRPERMGFGRARYATALQVLDPDRLSNPQQRMDGMEMRGGIELDADGAPLAYHIRKAHLNDWFAAGRQVQWERLPRETEWGRPVVVHHFDDERAGQHRPIGGILTPVLARMRMLSQYDRVELQAAIVNAIFGAYIQSPFDANQIQAAMDDTDEGLLSNYQSQRADFHADRRLMAGNVRMPTLFPGETIQTVSAGRPAAAFDMFEGAMLRHLATSIGSSYENVSGDYRGSTYSSARQATIAEGKTVDRRRFDFGAGWCTPAYVALLEEMIDRGDVPMPNGAPEFAEARFEYSRCRWVGPGRGWVDPVKEPQGSAMKIGALLSTHEQEVTENGGLDFEEVLDQREWEENEIKRRGLQVTLTTTGGQQPDAEEKAPEDEDV